MCAMQIINCANINTLVSTADRLADKTRPYSNVKKSNSKMHTTSKTLNISVCSGAPCDVSHSVCLAANLNERLHIHETGVQRAEGDVDLVKMRFVFLIILFVFHAISFNVFKFSYRAFCIWKSSRS